MDLKNQDNIKKIWLLSILAVAACFGFIIYAVQGEYTPARFTLRDQNNQIFDSRALKTHKLIFFGFTHCPDICPSGLAKITDVLTLIDQTEGLNGLNAYIAPVFITVDPERDTPQTLKNYIKNFHPDFIALTGDKSALQSVFNDYAVYARKMENNGRDYTVDHSGHIYLSDPDDIILEVFDYRLPAEKMAALIADHIRKGQQPHAPDKGV